MRMTATPTSRSVNATVSLDISGLADIQASPTITVQPTRLVIAYYMDFHGAWKYSHNKVFGYRRLKSGELSESRHQVYVSTTESWMAQAIEMFRPQNTPTIQDKPMIYMDNR